MLRSPHEKAATSGCHFWLERRHIRRSVAGGRRVVEAVDGTCMMFLFC
jgi:hypothetical protein